LLLLCFFLRLLGWLQFIHGDRYISEGKSPLQLPISAPASVPELGFLLSLGFPLPLGFPPIVRVSAIGRVSPDC
jgi:hypothetical protein